MAVQAVGNKGLKAHHCCLGGPGVLTPLQLVRPQLLDQLPSVDLDRTLHLTHAISSAGGITVILIALLKVIQPLLLCGSALVHIPEAADFSVGGDALAGSQSDVPRWAVALTEAALNAAVDNGRRWW